jgi:hypothetical protein
MARARGANAILCSAFEATYGTPPGSGFRKLPFVSASLGEEQGLIDSDLLGLGREPLPPSRDVVNNEGEVVVPVDLRNFGTWLKLLMGAPTTTGTVAASGAIVFSAQPAASSTITINGVAFTFVASAPTGNQIQIGANLSATITAIATALNASVNASVTPATYAASGGTTLTVTHDTLGTVGNAFTLAADGPSNGTVSGPTLTGGTNSHVFVSGSLSLPSMAIEIGLPEVPSYGMNFGARANNMKIALQRSGMLNATLALIAQGETRAAASAAGTPTSAVIERFAQFSGSVTRNGTALGQVVSADLSYANNLDKVEVIRSDGRIADVDPAMVALDGNVTVRFADTVLLDQASSGLPCELSFGWSINANKSLTITVHSVFLPKVKMPVQGPAGIQGAFSWKAAKDPTLNKTCTVTLINDVASY